MDGDWFVIGGGQLVDNLTNTALSLLYCSNMCKASFLVDVNPLLSCVASGVTTTELRANADRDRTQSAEINGGKGSAQFRNIGHY